MRIENKIAISILVILVGFPCLVFANTSANYENSSETVSAAGGTSSSANVSTSGTAGEVATGTSGSTNYQNSAGFPSNAEPQITENDPYDPNGDGVTTVADLQICVKQVLGITTPWPPADVSGDGFVTVVDVQKIVKRILGIS